MERIELLSPARDAATAIAAIDHGADAVYIGAPSHSARAAAANSVDDIRRVSEYAHQYGVRVYVTLNTIVYDDETEAVERLVWQLYRAGVDALIVQDMGLLRMHLPPIALHASTQCDTRTPQQARMLEDAGFSQIVLARELSTAEIAEIHRDVKVPLEAFVHGALCVSYSGDCRASLLATGRSANRGECAQICRYRFDLVDGNGDTLVHDKHLLSLRDMNRSARIEQMIEAGVRSFKIEGRLKDAAYVKNVTAWYRQRLDAIIRKSEGRYVRSSYGRSETWFTPDVTRSFNRGFTDYFAGTGKDARGLALEGVKMASMDTPKWRGRPIGTIAGRRGKALVVRGSEALHNGDGLGYFNSEGRFEGFRVNRVDGNMIYPATVVNAPLGTRLFRNNDKEYADTLERESARRTIDIRFTLRPVPQGIALDVSDERGLTASVAEWVAEPLQGARTPQEEPRRRVLEKTGDTIYNVCGVDDRLGSVFVPASVMATLRRRAIAALDSANRAAWQYDRRRAEKGEMEVEETITYHRNVANRLAWEFYSDHGAKRIEAAAEVTEAGERPRRVMTTRYCLRRELGRCLLTAEGRKWQEPLRLRSDSATLRLEFDCSNCRMHVDFEGKC